MMELTNMKIITLCGSLKFQKEMMEIAQSQALEGICVLTPTYPVLKNIDITDKQLNYFKEEHLKRIELSDAILVVDINKYIGESTNIEIEYAKKLGKEIIYYSKINKKNKSIFLDKLLDKLLNKNLQLSNKKL